MPDHGIASIRGVFSSGKAIKSTDPLSGTVWFYRDEPADGIVARRDDPPAADAVPIETVRRNINDDNTTVETVPVDDSPFGGDDA